MYPIDPFGVPSMPWPAIDTPRHVPSPEQEIPPEENHRLEVPADDVLQPAFFDGFDCLLMAQSAFLEGRDYFARKKPEAAVLLLGPAKDTLITHILVDEEGDATPVSFTLAAASLNRKVKPFLAAGIDIKGVWHLHPPGFASLSRGDLVYVAHTFQNPKNRSLRSFAMPITADGRFYGFVVTREENVLAIRRAKLVLV